MLAWLLPFLSFFFFFSTPLFEHADIFCLLQYKVHLHHPRFSQLWAGSGGSKELSA